MHHISYTIAATLLVASPAFSGTATQTDWSGGYYGTTIYEWGNEFKCQVGIDVYGTPGQLCLDSLEGYLESDPVYVEDPLRWVRLDWSGEMPEGTSVEFQIRCSQNGNTGDWSDTLTAPVYFDSPIRFVHRFIQYRVIMSSTDPNITPVLDEIRVTWQEQIFGVIEGTVTVRQSGDLYNLKGAAVVLEDQFQQYGVMADENGFYSFEAPAGIHTFRAMHVALIPHTIDSVLIQHNDTTHVNFILEPEPYTEGITIRSDENPNE